MCLLGIEVYLGPRVFLFVAINLFSSSELRTLSMSSSSDSERFACQIAGCSTTCARESDLSRHEKEVHHREWITCREPGCTFEGTCRHSKLETHMREQHPELFDVPLFVPEGFGCWFCIYAESSIRDRRHNGFVGEVYPQNAGHFIHYSTNVTMAYMEDHKLDDSANRVMESNTQDVFIEPPAPAAFCGQYYHPESLCSEIHGGPTSSCERLYCLFDLHPCAKLCPDTFDGFMAQRLWEGFRGLENVGG